jgi:hypothetical protein
MKLRIQDNSVRFRITLKELEQLRAHRELERTTTVPNARFSYGVVIDASVTETSLRVEPYRITIVLSEDDFARLADETQEGVYAKREWMDASGAAQRFIAFIEKDRPSTQCEKPEAWIYDEIPGRSREVKPMAGSDVNASGAADVDEAAPPDKMTP